MALSKARRSGGSHDLFWPGYVDVLSTLLLVVTFLLSVFMVAQFYVSQESTGKDSVLRRLQQQISELTNLLSLEKGQGKSLKDELSTLQATLATLKSDNERLSGIAGLGGAKDARIAALTKEVADKTALSSEAQAKVDLLNQQIAALRQQMAALQEAINAHEVKDKDSQARIADLGNRLNLLLAKQVQELQRYRSDFFGRLRELLRDRKDIRMVGDRFVFEFGGAVRLRPGEPDRGRACLHRPAGHGDRRAGAHRSQGDRLGAAGRRPHRHPSDRQRAIPVQLGAFQRARHHGREIPDQGAASLRNGWWRRATANSTPLEEGTSEEVLRRNRRIELKLTNR